MVYLWFIFVIIDNDFKGGKEKFIWYDSKIYECFFFYLIDLNYCEEYNCIDVWYFFILCMCCFYKNLFLI